MINSEETCPVCGEAAEDGDEGYCWNCQAHICPICNHPCEVPYGDNACVHYVLTHDGGGGAITDELYRDLGLLSEFADPLTEGQEEFLESLSEEELNQQFGSPSVIGWKEDLEEFVTQNLPSSATTTQDGPGWVVIYFHEAGGESAWESFVPVLRQQKAGRDWLNEQVSD